MDIKTQSLLSNLSELSNTGIENIGVSGFILILSVSLISSFFIAMLYLKFYGSRATGSQIHRAFPLLGMSVTAIFICIQFSLPLSLGLLGALSIVRFRTPIKEPEEIGFIMLVIGASIAVATFSLYFLLILLSFASVALFIQNIGFKYISKMTEDGLVLLTVDSAIYKKNIDQLDVLIEKMLVRPKLESISKSGKHSVISYSFRSMKVNNPINIQMAIEELLKPQNLNIYLNKQATL